MENVEIKEAKKQLDEIKKSKYEQELAEYRMKELLDKKAIEEYGFDAGMEKGIEKGIKQGLAQGINKEKIEIAKKLLKKGTPIEEIIELTELTEEEIKNLK